MSILDLPGELYFLIAENLTSPRDLNHLLLAHRGIAMFIAPVLSKYASTPPYAVPALFCFAASRNAPKVKSHLEELRKWDPDITTDVESIVSQGPNLVWSVPHKDEFYLTSFKTQRALHWAVINEKLSMIRYLISRGADIDYRDPTTGGKAMDHAILKGSSEMVKILIEGGADVRVWEAKCGSLLHCAIDCLLKTPYYAKNPEKIRAYEEILVLLLRGGADISVCDIYGHTVLHIVALTWAEAIPLLLEWGADINARDSYGNTPLHLATRAAQSVHSFMGPNMKSIETLLAMGADTTIKNVVGRHALYQPKDPYYIRSSFPDKESKFMQYMLRLTSLQGGRSIRFCLSRPQTFL